MRPARIALLIVALAGSMAVSKAAFSASASAATDAEDFHDAAQVTWAHAVNSRQVLELELAGTVDYLEADISLGHVTGNEVGPPQPIMAHPPKVTSDISLDRWLDIVIARKSNKGIKLDFKSIDIVEPSLKILDFHKGKLNFPLWLNADILPGPVNSPTTPVPATEFLTLCQKYFPNATLSLGWTTFWFSTFPPNVCLYSWEHIREMTDTLQCFESLSEQNVTFPVRALFASRSISKLQWLLEKFPKATLTVWSGKYDDLDMEDIKRIRQSFPKYKVYYDIPEPYDEQFRKIKDDIQLQESKPPTFFDQNWIKASKPIGSDPFECSSNTYVTSRSVMFGKREETAILLRKIFEVTDDKPLKASGVVSFFGKGSPGTPNKERQVIISIAQVKAFSTNVTAQGVAHTKDDTDLIWTALNSSQLHVFRHSNSSSDPSCHAFRLDTSARQSFLAWAVPCDKVDGNASAIPNPGKSEVPSRKILVLPPGPLMFGIISSGEGHSVVHDFEISGEKSSISKAWTASSTSVMQIIWTTMLAILATSLSSLTTVL